MKRFADHARTHSKYIIGGIIFLCAIALYIRTTAPTLGGSFDSEEFQFAASELAIVHSTGYPLYLILGKIFTTLVPIGNIAYRMNLLSAIIGAATVVIVYLNTQTLTQRQLPSIATAALFATNPAIWRQSGIASVGPLHFLIIALIVYVVLQWLEHKTPLTLVSLCLGLGLAHHRTSTTLAIPIGMLVLLNDVNLLRRPRDLAKNLFWLALPLLFYLYLPIFSNGSPWYSNTLMGFWHQITGTSPSDFVRNTPSAILEGLVLISQFLHDSFGYLGLILIIVGVSVSIRRILRQANINTYIFLGIATLVFYGQGIFLAGESDRYLGLPFLFLIYWFALGVSQIETWPGSVKFRQVPQLSYGRQIALAIVLGLFIALPFATRFRIADWSTFNRTYKLWDEVFTLPIPQNATMVGNWGQMNAMRYMQRIEHRRPDLQIVGTQDDPTPQTEAAQATLADGRTIFLAPGVTLPNGDYRYALLGPLLELRDKPQQQTPANEMNLAINPSLTLADYEITTALELYAPTTSIAPARTARVSLTWRAEDVVKDFLVRLKLFDPDGRLISQKDEAPVRGLYPASQWQRGEYVNDVHNFLIPAGSPPGKYQLKLQTLDRATKKSTSDEIMLASLNIERVTNLTSDQVFIQHPTDIVLNDRIALLGYGGLDNPRRAGETIGFSLVFAVRQNVGQDAPLEIGLVGSSGKAIAIWQRAPISFYPTREWHKGEILKTYYDLPLTENLPAGEYSIKITLGQQPTAIGKIQIVP
ncbi:MAG: DUF2723 domain-containing protein [Chloroflexi bacterium]|nr:DUF2723 domain-containing protein [Chloroflexota bacterium]